MNFYEVAVADRGLKTHQTLTYSCQDVLKVGQAVQVPLRNRAKNGVVAAEVKEPKYKTKPIATILPLPLIPEHLIKLALCLAEHYAVDLGTCVGLLIPNGANKKRRGDSVEQKPRSTKSAVELNEHQKKIVEAIEASPGSYLLRGVTGSGKTRVYIELAKKARRNKQATIILVPEIGLTSQMVDEVMQYFTDEVFVIHSNQTEADRHKLWVAISEAKAPIVIGPRSALFSPIKNLGLIVIDEEHETSYKQDVSPKYHAVRVASKLRQLVNGTLVLGSATPNIEDYFRAEQHDGSILEMTQPVQKQHKTEVELVDIKQRDRFTSNTWLSDPLLGAMKQTIADGKQAILFHNRRGSSTSVVCQNCGWVSMCPNCELPLTHHADWRKLVCHVCNHRENIQSVCPDCKSSELVYRGAGTKEIVVAAQKLFPDARIERFDSDITAKADKLEERYESLVKGDVDIIIGTQMIAKGLDLPKLGLVGVVLADTSLYLPDYSSNERTYQLITQVVGRGGRHQDGKVVIQSYNPDSPAIKYAIDKNWTDFYRTECADRKVASYPPHTFLLKLIYENKQDADARQQATSFASMLRKNIKNIDVLGPSPAFHHKTRTGWRWQIVVKSNNRQKLTHIARHVPANWQFELDPINLL